MTIVTNPARTRSSGDIPSSIQDASFSSESDLESRMQRMNTDAIEEAQEYLESIRMPTNSCRLFNDERRADIVFVAGIGDDTWRYPGHRKVLSDINPAFAAALNTNSDVIRIDYVDRRGFEQLLRYQYCEGNNLTSVTTAKCTLDAAYKFLTSGLVERCARRLDEMLDAGVALEILRDLRFYCSRLPGAASAPTLMAIENDLTARLLALCSRWCDCLAHNALLVLDDNADAALADERLEELTYEDLALIVKRDTFRVSSELVFAEALHRWATAACKRTKHEITAPNRRAALGELGYCPRYLLLKGEELERALALELLDPIEKLLVIARARNLSAPIPVGAQQEELLRRWARPRPSEPKLLPVHLSPRSAPPDTPPTTLCSRARARRRGKKPDFAYSDQFPKKKRNCCARFGDGLLRAFICLFD